VAVVFWSLFLKFSSYVKSFIEKLKFVTLVKKFDNCREPRGHKGLTLDSLLSHVNPVYILTPVFSGSSLKLFYHIVTGLLSNFFL
jgi:hypothetical protein